jgi:alpha-mannosidase
MSKSMGNWTFTRRVVSRFGEIVAILAMAALVFCFFQGAATAESKKPAAEVHYAVTSDLAKQPTLYVVGYAHLDTQWRWAYPQVIQEYLTKTMRNNFALFEKYPHYVFNFSGSNRYRMMKEYYPADYAKVKQYVAAGRWFPAGSSVEESDVNSPSAESLFRQILYGNQYFRREFGKTSSEYMLPDCFGFPASLPSILAHAGIEGFSTQKLSWHSAARVGGPDSPEKTPIGIPFNVGIWEGPDGKSVIAALDPGSYVSQVSYDLSKTPPAPNPSNPEEQRRTTVDWPKRIQLNGDVSGLFTDYRYYGSGDIGGSPKELSVKLMEAIVTKGLAVLQPPGAPGQSRPQMAAEVRVGDGPLRVISATAEQMFLDIKPAQMAKLPRFKGDLLLTEHSAGSISSETYMKRWNRQNELLADDAERVSVAAQWLGGRPYPLERLNNAWTLVMGGQFHDILPGTSIPKAYEYAWNDEVLAMNQFAGVLTSATEAIASSLNTQAKGTAIVVYNPLNIQREDVVEATVTFPNGVPQAVRVFGPDGEEVPGQLATGNNGAAKALFLAKVPSVGFAVYDVQAADPALRAASASTLNVTESSLENSRYRIRVDENGDVASIFDKTLNKELLSKPARLAFQHEKPEQYPAWNMDWTDQQKPPRAYVQGPAKIRIAENGPVRVALEVEREAEGSRFVQTIRLSAGDAGNRVEFGNVIDWKIKETALKATFPLTAANPEATYNWDIGTIRRGSNDEKKFEVPSHQWFDLTDKSGAYGVTVLSDCKIASDKPDDSTLRLTLLYSPGISDRASEYGDQATQDWGHHEFVYGLAGHAGDWRQEQTDWQALRLNQPLVAFESPKHLGALGKNFSFMHLNNSRVRVLALKKAEQSDEVVIRLVEIDGKPEQQVRIAFAAPIAAAREVNAQEMPLRAASVTKGELVTDFAPYQPRTFAVTLAAAPAKMAVPASRPITLRYDASVATRDGRPAEGCFDCSLDNPNAPQGKALPAEMLPTEIAYAGIRFHLAPAGTGKPDAMTARGQTINLPAGKFNRLHILAASADGDQKATFRIDDKPVDLTIQNWGGYIGQWDNRLWKMVEMLLPPEPSPGDTSVEARRAARIRARVKEHGPIMVPEYVGLTPGYIKRSPVAWFASHRHAADGTNEPYSYSYLFAYSIGLPANAKTLTLPANDKIRILAITVADQPGEVHSVQPLVDTLGQVAER